MQANWQTRLKMAVKLGLKDLPPKVGRPMSALCCRVGITGDHFRTFVALGMPDAVLSGPFKGMRYVPEALGSAIIPKFLGTYEMELHEEIENLCTVPCDLLVDIGAAEGYYAVGLARRLRPNRVVCFDINPLGPALARRIARRNDVEELLTYQGLCTTDNLEATLRDAASPLLVIDCEGFEDDLLLPEQVPSLRRTVVLVELHDFVREDVSTRIRERFEPTHDIRLIRPRSRQASDVPEGVVMDASMMAAALEEGRSPQNFWYVMTPRIQARERVASESGKAAT